MIPKGASPEDEARIQREYQQEWRAYSEAIVAVGLDFDNGSQLSRLPADPGAQMWRLDGGEWQSAPLRPSGK